MEENQIQIYTEPKGMYTIVKDKKVWQVLFPVDASVRNNLEVFEMLAVKIKEAVAREEEKDKEKDKEKEEAKIVNMSEVQEAEIIKE